MRKTYLGLIALALVLGAGAWYLLSRPHPATPAPKAGRPAPEIALTEQATGQTVRLPADQAGKAYAIQFFSYT